MLVLIGCDGLWGDLWGDLGGDSKGMDAVSVYELLAKLRKRWRMVGPDVQSRTWCSSCSGLRPSASIAWARMRMYWRIMVALNSGWNCTPQVCRIRNAWHEHMALVASSDAFGGVFTTASEWVVCARNVGSRSASRGSSIPFSDLWMRTVLISLPAWLAPTTPPRAWPKS